MVAIFSFGVVGDPLVINGVTFSPMPGILPNNNNSDIFLGTTGDESCDELLGRVDLGGGGDFFTVTVGDGDGDAALSSEGLLQVGDDYLIQVWFVDDRPAQDARVMQFGDGNGQLPETSSARAIRVLVAGLADHAPQRLAIQDRFGIRDRTDAHVK